MSDEATDWMDEWLRRLNAEGRRVTRAQLQGLLDDLAEAVADCLRRRIRVNLGPVTLDPVTLDPDGGCWMNESRH